MKKRLIAGLLCLCMVLCLLPVTAFANVGDTFEVDNSEFDLEFTVLTEPSGGEPGTVKLSAFWTCPAALTLDMVTKNSGEQYKVTAVGSHALQYAGTLTSISMPNVTTIEESAFTGCSSLASVDLPRATSIGNSAFAYCSSLTSLSLPAATSIGDTAFRECALTSVSLPSATSIGEDAFKFCADLTSVNLPVATSIGNGAFQQCSNLAGVNIPAVTSIGGNAFESSPKITSITIWQTTPPTLGSPNPFVSIKNAICVLNVPADATGYDVAPWPTNQTQLLPVSGKVYDAQVNPATGATVTVNGVPVQTDADGTYTVYVASGYSGDVTATWEGSTKTISLSSVAAGLTGQNFNFGTVATPTFSPVAGSLVDGQTVTLSSATDDVTFYYTTDGSTPTAATGTEYTGAITLTADSTIKAIAVKDGVYESAVGTAAYTLAFSVTLPTGTGYTVAPQSGSTSPVANNGSYSFTVSIDSTIAEKGTDFAVKANGTALTPVGDVYTVNSITAAQTITVEGVKVLDADYTAVDAAIAAIPADLTLYTDTTAAAVTTAKDAVVRDKDITEQDTVDGYATAINNAVAALVYKDADYTAVDEAIASIPADLSLYSDTTVATLNAAKTAVVRGKNITEQALVNKYAVDILQAIVKLQYKDAVYAKVNAAIAKIPTDLTLYTDASVNALKQARDAVVPGKDITEQAIVDGYATAIENAIKALVYKSADYTAVDAALAKIPADLSQYTDASVAALNAAKNAIVRGKNITEQAVVDGYVTALEKAITGLAKKPATSALPSSTIPRTDDASHPYLWVVLLLITGTAMTVLGMNRKKAKRSK